MHNVPEKDIYRPAAWNAFGMDKEGADFQSMQELRTSLQIINKTICKNVYRPPGIGDDLTFGRLLYQGNQKTKKPISVCTDTSLLYIYVCVMCVQCVKMIFGMNMPKSRDIQVKIPLPQAIWNNFGYVTVNSNEKDKSKNQLLITTPFLKHYICIQSFFACGNNAICSFGFFFIESETFNISNRFIAALVIFGNDFFICIPDWCFYIIARHNFHEIFTGCSYISIQWKQFGGSHPGFRVHHVRHSG